MSTTLTPEKKPTGQTRLKIPGAILLTDSEPFQAKAALWPHQCSLDMIANHEHYEYSFKDSSILCPHSAKPLTGEAVNVPEGKTPWDIFLNALYHERTEDEKACELSALLKKKQGALMSNILQAHRITTLRALTAVLSLSSIFLEDCPCSSDR